MMEIREARLRPEFADRYPGIEPGIWFIAATLAEHVMGRVSHGAERPEGPAARVLDSEHFEFRGTGPAGGMRATFGRP